VSEQLLLLGGGGCGLGGVLHAVDLAAGGYQ
jgi:hypothetical protein